MLVKELLIVFFSTFAFSLIFVFAFNNKGPWGNFWNFSIVDFLAVWAIMSWINPDYLDNNAVIIILPISLMVTFLMAASAPLPQKSNKVETLEKHQVVELNPGTKDKTVFARYNIYFWIMLILLSIIILIRYIFGVTSIGFEM